MEYVIFGLVLLVFIVVAVAEISKDQE